MNFLCGQFIILLIAILVIYLMLNYNNTDCPVKKIKSSKKHHKKHAAINTSTTDDSKQQFSENKDFGKSIDRVNTYNIKREIDMFLHKQNTFITANNK